MGSREMKRDTAERAVGNLEGRVKDGQTSSIARELQRRASIREQVDRERNERIRRARDRGQGLGGGDAA